MQNPKQLMAAATGAIVALLVVIAWMAGMFNDRVEPGLKELRPANNNDAIEVELVEIDVFEYATASIIPDETTRISSRILARITSVEVRASQQVKKGDVLARLEQSDLKARMNQAAEQVIALEARKIEAATNRNRAEQLYKQQLIAKADLDRAVANHDELVAAKAAAELALDEAQTALAYSEIRAPINGRIVDRLAEPGDTVTPGAPILSLYNPRSLQARADVRETLSVDLRIGQEIVIEVPGLNTSFDAAIVEIVPAVNPGSRSFQVKAAFDYDERLLPGMYARMKIPAKSAQAIVVPQELVAQMGQLNVVWVLVDGSSQRRFVELGEVTESGVVVQSGLQPGDKLLRPGA
ncbi:MAG: efflux RND transporter periplasmic adaptor subunit [Pseudomonadales bacterium]